MKANKIFAALLIISVLGMIGYRYYSYQSSKKEITQEVAQKEVSENAVSNNEKTGEIPKETKSVDIQVTPPINGTKKGVIEVGATGFNCFVVDIDKDKNWELVSKEFGQSLAYEGFATVDDVEKGLKTYLSSIFDKGVSGRNAHFVISSGALKNQKTLMIAQAIEKMGYVVNKVDASQEGKYALKALLPKSYRTNSFVTDIGSGNTKISWYEGTSLRSVECSGAKYYQDGKLDNDVYNEILTAVSKVPEDHRENCFIIGGVPFKLAKQTRKGEERYTLLASPDEYSGGDDVKIKSGINIYRALYDGSKTEKFIFDWDANFTIGFLLNLN